MSEQGRKRRSTSASTAAADLVERSSRRSHVSDPPDSAPGSVYNVPTDADSLDLISSPPVPVKPPGEIGTTNTDPRLAGNSADEYFNDITTTPSDSVPATPASGTHALSRRRTSSHGLSNSNSTSHAHSSRRTRSHSSARDILRVLLSAESSQSREALALLRRVQERLEVESHRANDAERRLQDARERWVHVSEARKQAQAEAHKVSEELRLHKLQLEAAQHQIARANDMVALTEKERTQAEDEAAKARRAAKKLEMEREIQRARDDGRREGVRQGRREAREAAAYETRSFPRELYDRYRDRHRYRSRARDLDEGTYIDDDDLTYQYIDDEEYPADPGQVARHPQEIPAQPIPRSAPPNGVPGQTHSSGSRGQRRSSGILNSLTRLGRVGSGRRESGVDRNVAVNPSYAPDIATIIDEEPINTLASPLPPEQTTQINHTTSVRMPEPDFDPDPSQVRPISIPGTPRAQAHPPSTVPPEGFIPRQDEDGLIRLPPAHEMGQAPPTPRSYRSPLPNPSNLPPAVDPVLPERERAPISRDFAPQPRSHSRHHYQKSVSESDDSIATAALSIISPPAGRPSTLQQSRLSAIPEHDPRYASPGGSMRQAEGPVYPTSPRSRSSRYAEADDVYVPGDPVLDSAIGRRSMVDGGPARPMDMVSPRSNHSRFSGPKRPSYITTPARLAPDSLDQPAYTRPRFTSVTSGSDHSGFTGTPRPSRSRDKTPAPEPIRSRPSTAANTPAYQTLPEINVIPASHFESSQSNANAPPDRGVMISPRRTQSQTPQMLSPAPSSMPVPQPPIPLVPEPPSPMNMPGVPRGFVPSPMPLAPTIPNHEAMPNGFVPTSPAIAPPDAPLGFLPTSPAVPHQSTLLAPDVPPGFVPTSPAVIPGAPPGFIPASPAVIPGAPPGFVPTSPAVPQASPLGSTPVESAIPNGAPPGFIPASPVPPEGAPRGFVPTSTVLPMNSLPQPSPAISIAGALPVLPRSESERSTWQVPTVTRTKTGSPRSPRLSFSGPNAGFNSRAASEWDTHSAWGDPLPVRGPDLSATIVRPGSSLSRRGSSPVIPNAAAWMSSGRSSRAGDPVGVPLPASTAPSLARSGRASSHAESRSHTPGPSVARSQSARASSTTRGKMYPPGTPARPSVSGLPPTGLGSPFSRRLDPHPEDADEYEIVPSDDSNNTLTTPPGRRNDLPPPGSTPMVPVRNALYTHSPGASLVSLSATVGPLAEPAPGPPLRKSASRQSIGSNSSYAKFDPNGYVDPAVLTSGRSRLMPLPLEETTADPAPSTAKGKKAGKGKKGKGRR